MWPSATPAPRRAAGTDSQPVPLDSQPGRAELAPGAARSPRPWRRRRRATTSRYEPIQADEVAAFKQALAAGVANPAAAAAAARGRVARRQRQAFDGSAMHGPQSYTLLTGFEDTEMPDAEQRMPSLSGTQYGDLN